MAQLVRSDPSASLPVLPHGSMQIFWSPHSVSEDGLPVVHPELEVTDSIT